MHCRHHVSLKEQENSRENEQDSRVVDEDRGMSDG